MVGQVGLRVRILFQTMRSNCMQDLIDSQYAYTDWANAKVLDLCAGLSDAQLDQPKEMGFGTLRATLFHILAADTIWLERWQGQPWRPFPTDPAGMSVNAIADGLRAASSARSEFIQSERNSGWLRIVEFKDSKQNLYQLQLRDLLLHVCHHGVHHRAQALNYLKQFERKLAGGVDYLFYRLAQGALQQSPEAVASLSQHGLAVNERLGTGVTWDAELVARQFEYSDWANGKLLAVARTLDAAQLDRGFDIGQGSLRKILLHIYSAERWWATNWTAGASPFPRLPETTSIGELCELWRELAIERDRFLGSLDETAAQRAIELSFSGPLLRFPIVDTVTQLTMHGTHHRAQVVNLLRQVGSPSGNIDLLYALAELSPSKKS